jgi:Na+/H+-dicarboxylate symporter
MGKNQKAEMLYQLDRPGVDQVADALSAWMEEAGVGRPDRLRIRLTMETLLLNVSEHYGGDIEGTLKIGKRLGTPYFRFRYEGEAYDPRTEEDSLTADAAVGGKRSADADFDTSDTWTKQILAGLGLAPSWRYHNGVNEITLQAPRSGIKQETLLVIAVAAAVILGAAGSYIPDGIRDGVAAYLLTPVSNLFLNLLGTFSGILVFLSVLCGVCGIGNAADFSKKGKYVMLHYLGRTAVCGLILGALTLPFYHFGSIGGSGESQFGALLDMVLAIFPHDPITPFAEGNMMQIVFMAICLGATMLVLGERTEGLRDMLTQLNATVIRVVEAICLLLPIYIFASLILVMWENGIGIFLELWKPLLLCVVLTMAAYACKAVITGIRLKVSAAKLLRKTRPALIVGLTTSSSMAAFGTVLENNEKELGIDPTLSRFAVPIGNLLCCGPTTGVLMLIVIHLASAYGVAIGFAWFITLWIMCVVMSVALPPVSGGVLVCLGLLLAQCNIPAAALGVAGTMAILFDFFDTGTRVGMMQMEVARQANHFGMLDRDVLEK